MLSFDLSPGSYVQDTWPVCSNLTMNSGLLKVILWFITRFFELKICNVQGTWLVCFTLMMNSGPAKSYPLIYHQALRVDICNVQGTWLVFSTLKAMDLLRVILWFLTRFFVLIICNVQGTWLLCSTLTAHRGPAKIYPLIYHQVLYVHNLQCAGHVVGVLYPDGE
jgi:hypothetical protein